METATESASQPNPRRNKIAEEKAALRAELAALANKVPAEVCAGSVQTTHNWLSANERPLRVAAGLSTGRCAYTRMSRKHLDALTRSLKGLPPLEDEKAPS